MRNWLSSLSLKISPRANLLLVPRCHAGDEEVFIKPMQSDSFSNSLQCWGGWGEMGGGHAKGSGERNHQSPVFFLCLMSDVM